MLSEYGAGTRIKSDLASCLRLLPLVLGRDEPDRPLGRIGRRHEFAQRVEDLLELVARVATEGTAEPQPRMDGCVRSDPAP